MNKINDKIYDVVLLRAAESPEKTAIEYGIQRVSYRELEINVHKTESFICREGSAGRNIFVVMDRGPQLVEGMIGIMKSGSVFVPADPDLPEKRLLMMLEESKSVCVLTCAKQMGKIKGMIQAAGMSIKVYAFEDILESEEACLCEPKGVENPNGYIYFTSGSTGTPKGVLGRIRSLQQFVSWEAKELELNQDCKVSQLTPPSFDPFLRDVFLPLYVGGTLCIPEDNETILNARRLIQWMDESGITLTHMVPSLFKTMMNEVMEASVFLKLKHIVLAGEMLRGRDVKKFVSLFDSRIVLINMYGPTETTLAKFFHRVRSDDAAMDTIPVGRPIDKAAVLILDEDRQLLREGNTGEIYIRTPFISSGYFNDPKKTKEVFLKNPFSSNKNDMIYKTGDLGKILEDGNLLIVGRVDDQVKIRGHRIEPNEIVNKMLALPFIQEGAVIDKEINSEITLCAYYTASEVVSPATVKKELENELPGYMMPACFFQLDHMPLTRSGKIDRKFLKMLEVRLYDDTEYIPPESETEIRLAAIWEDIFSCKKAGKCNNFFKMGGHSLKAVALASQIYKEFGVDISIGEIFRLQTLEKIAACIDETSVQAAHEAIEPVNKCEGYPEHMYPLSSAQKSMYIIHQLNPDSIHYNTVKAFWVPEDFDIGIFENALNSVIERHEILRTSFHQLENGPAQKVHNKVEFHIEKEIPMEDAEGFLETFIRPFDLKRVPLLRVGCSKVKHGKRLMILDIHHIICDGISMLLLTQELMEAYRGHELLPVSLQYKDYAVWQNRKLKSEDMENQMKYWLDRFSGELPVLDIHTDFERPKVQDYEGDSIPYIIDGKLSSILYKMMGDMNVTLYTTLLSIYNILLWKYSGQEDIIVGTPVAGRRNGELDHVIGMFANTLAMRNYPNGEKTFEEFIREVEKCTLEAFENQDVPFEELVDKLHLVRDMSRNPVFDAMLVLQNIYDENSATDAAELRTYQYQTKISRFDMILAAFEEDNGVHIDFFYCKKLYQEDTIRRLAGHFMEIVGQIAENPRIKLSEIQLLTYQEKDLILNRFVGRVNSALSGRSAVSIFEEQAEKNKDRVAVEYYHTGRMELWPSVAEYFIYDDLLYYSMTHDKYRNRSYQTAVEQLVRDKVVVEIGTGADAILSRLCVSAGAAKVYAIEILKESYEKARTKIINYGLEDKIILIHGDAAKVDLPERADVCISEIVGAIAGSEGAAVILNQARRLMKEDGIMLPIRSCTNIAAVSLPEEFIKEPYFSETGAAYTKKVFQYTGNPFDLRVCLKNFSREYILSNTELFEDLDYNQSTVSENYTRDIRLVIKKDEVVQGFLLWLKLYTLNDVFLDILDHEFCWLPVFVPVFYPGIQVMEGDVIEAVCEGKVSCNGINIDYTIRGSLKLHNGVCVEFDYQLPHFEKAYQSNKFYQKVFENGVIHTLNPDLPFKQMTYGLLNKKANQLAHFLKKEGIGSGSFVGLSMERSAEMMVGILGVLKTGAAYLPLDSEYPPERLAFMIKDTGIDYLLTQNRLKSKLPYEGRCLCLDTDWNSLWMEDESDLTCDIDPEDPAYVIYTSGSTGKPKGVILTHKGLVNTAMSQIRQFGITPEKKVLQFASYSFDASVSEIFMTFFCGAALYVYYKSQYVSIEEIRNMLISQKVNVATLPPSMLKNLSGNDFPNLQVVISAGEPCTPEILKSWMKNNRSIFNAYGPTEGTICASIYDCSLYQDEAAVPIGRPMENTLIYILDQYMNPVPVGVDGELCIGGPGVANGYLNRPDLNSKCFIRNPFADDPFYPALYRTGDKARWRPDGMIEFVGRKDDQIKIRGFRVELGEIENVLDQYENIRESAARAIVDTSGNVNIYAYIVSSQEDHLSVSELRKYLQNRLPEYMIPSKFIQLPEMPLTSNNKIDRKALAAWNEGISADAVYKAPENSIQKKLVMIWQEVLSVDRIGIQDNFFELGGDSIKALQIAARLNKENLMLEVKDLFQCLNIENLSRKIERIQQVISQDMVTGSVRLTPIQRWFFERAGSGMHHFNQSIMLFSPSGFKESILKNVMAAVCEHHDVLRMVFKKQGDEVIQINRSIEGSLFTLDVYHCENEEDFPCVVEERADEIQRSINVSEGPLVKMALFHVSSGAHLLIAVHHLVMDGVSFRILLEDLSAGYRQVEAGKTVDLGSKTTSFQEWSERLYRYANGNAIEREKDFWKKVMNHKHMTLPRKAEKHVFRIRDESHVSFDISKEETRQLLMQVNRAYRTEVNDILLTALAKAAADWLHTDTVEIKLEGHGRENMIQGINISRTIGWFTSLYPLVLSVEKRKGLSWLIMSVKEQIRKIPNKGIGYGLIRYMMDDDKKAGIAFQEEPDISFNYLGQFDQDVNNDVISISALPTGQTKSPEMERDTAVSINSIIIDGKLKTMADFCEQDIDREEIIRFFSLYEAALRELISHCISQNEITLTPSDLGDNTLTLLELEDIRKAYKPYQVKKIYQLTNMQKGMLFHSQKEKESTAYFQQAVFDIEGIIDLQEMTECFHKLMDRQEILKGVIVSRDIAEPRMALLDGRELAFYYLDLSEECEQVRGERVREFLCKDRQTGFNLSRDMLFRITVFKMEEKYYKILWSFHHILLDGWSFGIIMKEFLDIYTAIRQGTLQKYAELPVSYGAYMEWYLAQDFKRALGYWNEYLKGYDEKLILPGRKNAGMDQAPSQEELVFRAGSSVTKALMQMAKDQNVTVNTVIQTVWGVILQKYNHTKDVVFGTIISGRPASVKGMDQIAGLFINNIPCRVLCSENTDFFEVLKKTQEDAVLNEANGFIPLAEIQAASQVKQNLIHHILVFENYPIDEAVDRLQDEKILGFRIRQTEVMEETNYDFNITVLPGNNLTIKLSFDSSRYYKKIVRNIGRHVLYVLEQVLNNIHIKIDDIEIADSKEINEIQKCTQMIKHEYPRNKIFVDLFEMQAAKTPYMPAVSHSGLVLTYDEINKKANQMARVLKGYGIGRGNVIAIVTERSIHMVTSVLAVLKAGGTYLPIDALYPVGRINYMIRDSQADLLIISRSMKGTIDCDIRMIDMESEEAAAESTDNLIRSVNQDDLMYLIYTSGSTGNPKGVMVSHGSYMNMVDSWQKEYGLEQFHIRLLQMASFSFDVFAADMGRTLTAGGAMVICPDYGRADIQALYRLITDEKITMLDGTPAVMIPFMDYVYEQKLSLPNLRLLILGSDACAVEDFRRITKRFGKAMRILNCYGITEATIDSSFYEADPSDMPESGSTPIGRPIWNTQFYIVDDQMKLSPIGVSGELCISGVSLARGYVGNESLTAERFVDNPFGTESRLFRTGDRAKWMLTADGSIDGNVEFTGRMDHQIKVRGYRIEAGEIESRLLQYHKIREAAVLVLEDKLGEKYICAFVTSVSSLSYQELRGYLSGLIPDYMIPARFVRLEEMPLTLNKKIDRKRLSEKAIGQFITDDSAQMVQPEGETERSLAEIWKDLLELNAVSTEANFFEIGGHSLKAMLLASRIHKVFQVEVPINQIFRQPTIREMAVYIDCRKGEDSFNEIPLAVPGSHYPMSSAQKRLYMISQLDGIGTSYNVPDLIRLEKEPDQKRLQDAFIKLMQRHESLRTSFDTIDGELTQIIHPECGFSLEYIEADKAEIKQIAAAFVQEFDLSCAPLFRAALVKVNNSACYLLMDMHHIISDGVSALIIARELSDLYQGKELKPLKLQYKDYTMWQHSRAGSERMKKQEDYWLSLFDGEIPVLNLPLDYMRPPRQSFEGGCVRFEADSRLTAGIREIAKQTETTVYMVLLAAFNVLLYRYTDQEDIVVGTPAAGRNHTDLRNIVGMFVNTLALRNYPASDRTFFDFLLSVKENCLNAFDNQDYPLEQLIDKLRIARDMSRNPLFDVMFALEKTENSFKELYGSVPEDDILQNTSAKFDITLSVTEADDSMYFSLGYCSRLFRKDTMERMAGHYFHILETMDACMSVPLSKIDLLLSEESRLLNLFHGTKADYPGNKTIHQVFEEQALKFPQRTAVIYEGERLTYGDLNVKSNRLAAALVKLGVKPGKIVAIMAERSIDIMTAILGVLKSGGAYLSIDPLYPHDRIQYMLKDSQAEILLVTKGVQKEAVFGSRVLCLSDPFIYDSQEDNLNITMKSTDPAYIIYTSGTTGRPKSVMTQHKSIINISCAWTRLYKLDEFKVSLLQAASFSFDVFVADMARALLNGGQMVICPAEKRADYNALYELICDYKINFFNSTPALIVPFMKYIYENNLPMEHMKVLIIGADVLPSNEYKLLVDRYGKQMRIFNCYGVTEAAIDSSYYEAPSEEIKENSITPIGKPFENVNLYIVNKKFELQPIGVYGELCIGGDGVAEGYRNNETLTKEKFITIPAYTQGKVYRTGDYARWDIHGNVEFIGRRDNQVKVRGHRIELGEIESRMMTYAGINQAVLTMQKDTTGNNSLCAYFTAEDIVKPRDLRQYLSSVLPEYMLPSYYIQLDEMPLTPNRKIDRKSLPEPDGSRGTQSDYEAPGNKTEARLAAIWAEVLGTNQAGIHDNFFEWGGHSLSATVLISRIHQEFHVKVPLKEVFNNPVLKNLAEYIRSSRESIYTSIEQVEEMEYYPLSAAQNRMYMINQLEGAKTSYNMPSLMRIHAKIDRDKFEQAILEVIRRHEILRTTFHSVEGQIVQKVHENSTFKVQYLNAGEVETAEILKTFIKPFDFSEGPLLRICLIHISDEECLLLLDMHHIISDGRSVVLFMREMVQLYEGGRLEPLKIQYKDFAVWQNHLMSTGKLKTQEKYWLSILEGDIPVLNLQTDYKRPPIQNFEGDSFTFEAGQDLTRRLIRLGRETRSTLYMVLLSAYNILLYHYTGQEDILIGTPVAGRLHADLQESIGIFVNTLVMRNRPEGGKSYREFLMEVKENTLEAFENQDCQFEELVQKLNIKRDLSRNPLFDIMFVMQNAWEESIENFREHVEYMEPDVKVSNFDITLSASPTDENLYFRLEYCTKLFNRDTMERFSKHFLKVLEEITEHAEVKLTDIELITEEEKQRVLFELNPVSTQFSKDKTIVQLFEEQVLKTSDRHAVIYKKNVLTYSQLDQKANQLAAMLRKHGVTNGSIVGILTERLPEMIIGIFGILKAEAAYLPVDAEKYPAERINYMIHESGMTLMLSTKNNMDRYESLGLDVQLTAIEDAFTESCENVKYSGKPNDLAYIIYTSGSTGNPKGVMVEHGSVVNLSISLIREFKITQDSRILQFTSFCFDVSVSEIMMALLSGAELYLEDKENLLPGPGLNRILKENRITALSIPAPVLTALPEEELPDLKTIIVGGEAFTEKLVKRFQRGRRFINCYGPTEATVCTTMSECQAGGPVYIGRPIDHVSVYVLNQSLNPVPVGIPGELYIGGAGLARGYLNNETLTHEHFIRNPFDKEGGSVLYKTGDLVKLHADGNLEFIDRIDSQIKIRGYRIEPAEIEAVLLSCEGVKEAVVSVYNDKAGSRMLCAYLVSGMTLDMKKVKRQAALKLPDYMIPSYYVQVTQMPLTSNGKVDKKRLPEPDRTADTGTEYVPASSNTEIKLHNLWIEVLGIERAGIYDHFFESGGNSLSATVLVSRIYKEFKVEIPLSEVFKHPVISELARLIDRSQKEEFTGIAPADRQDYYPLSCAQKRMYILNQLGGSNTAYHMPSLYMVEGKLDIDRLFHVLEQLVNRHESLRTSFEEIDGVPVQRIHEHAKLSIKCIKAEETKAEELLKNFVRKFDFNKAPLFRILLIQLNVEKYYLAFDMHHIISDGVSMGILMDELAALYEGRELTALPIQYKDFAVWQNRLWQDGKMREQEAYWINHFNGQLPTLDLPFDYKRPALQSFAGDDYYFSVGKEMTDCINVLSRDTESTLYMILLSVYNILLHRYTGQNDIIVGTPVAGRENADTQNIIGLFMNTLAMRNYPDGEKTMLEFLLEVKENVLGAFENQSYPFDILVEKLDIRRDISRNALFDTMFVLQNLKVEDLHMEGLKIEPLSMHGKVSKSDITLHAAEKNGMLHFHFQYCTKLFARSTVERMAAHFSNILNAAVREPDKKIKDLQMITESERNLIQNDFNHTYAEYKHQETIVGLFEKQAERVPDRTAVVFGQDRVTYRTLNRMANQLAYKLTTSVDSLNEKDGTDTMIGIVTKPCIEMIVGILAVLKAGWAYLPIDPELPKERADYMLEHSGAPLLLVTGTEETEYDNKVRRMNILDPLIYQIKAFDLAGSYKGCGLAYIIYTSGTTGLPKGVMVENCGVVNYIEWFTDKFRVTEEDKTLLMSSASFDLGYTSLFSVLAKGGELHLMTKEQYMEPEGVKEYLIKYGITYLKMTPSMFQLWTKGAEGIRYDALRLVVLGGEKMDYKQVLKFNQNNHHVRFVNHYGPTEMTIGCIAQEIDPEKLNMKDEKSVIGRPISNTRAMIIDKYGNMQPVGIPGELLLSGEGLCRGYFKDERLTEEMIRSVDMWSGSRGYKSGDLCKWQQDGTLVFLGRCDQQVKIRGYRIELEEIEKQALCLSGILNVAAKMLTDRRGDTRICLFYTASSDMDENRLKAYLSLKLPRYMLPSCFTRLEKLPYTSNGKLDKKALLVPKADAKKIIEPVNSIEEELVDIWKSVLPDSVISTEDDFFELGGNSLKAGVVITSIYKRLNIKIPLIQVFRTPVLRQLAEFISIALKDKEQINAENMYLKLTGPVSDGQRTKKPLFAFTPVIGSPIVFKGIAEYVDSHCIYGLEYLKDDDKINAYADLITSLCGQDCLELMGYSVGGNIAFEVAKELEQRGRRVSKIIMIDSYKRSEKTRKRNGVHLNDGQNSVMRFLSSLQSDEDTGYSEDDLTLMLEEAGQVAQDYADYAAGLMNAGSVRADIYLLQSDEAAAESVDMEYLWQESTTGQFKVFRGAGRHETMLSSRDSIEFNGKVLEQILSAD